AGGISIISQCAKSTRGRSAGTVRPSLLTSSPRLGTSPSMQASANDFVPAGASLHARCGLRLADSTHASPWSPGLPNANSGGMRALFAKLSLRICIFRDRNLDCGRLFEAAVGGSQAMDGRGDVTGCPIDDETRRHGTRRSWMNAKK